MMIAYASSDGVMFVPEKIERKIKDNKETVRIRKSNDNPKNKRVAKVDGNHEVLVAAE